MSHSIPRMSQGCPYVAHVPPAGGLVGLAHPIGEPQAFAQRANEGAVWIHSATLRPRQGLVRRLQTSPVARLVAGPRPDACKRTDLVTVALQGRG